MLSFTATELFSLLMKNDFTTSNRVKNTLEKAGLSCQSLQSRDSFMNVNKEFTATCKLDKINCSDPMRGHGFVSVKRRFFLPAVAKVLTHRGSYDCWGFLCVLCIIIKSLL